MSQRLPGTGTCLIPKEGHSVSLYMCHMVYSGLSLKTDSEQGNKSIIGRGIPRLPGLRDNPDIL